MSTITKGREIMTLVNVFTVEPEDQNRLVQLLVDATEQTMKNLPGFVSANIHRSLDGKQVINYAQWRSQADFDAMRQNPAAGKHMKEASALAQAEPSVCEVVEAIAAGDT
jgi:quinol monooxygenase YgiN